MEARNTFELFDDGQCPAPFLLFDPIQQLSAVAAICPDQNQAGQDCHDGKKHQPGPVPVLNVGFVNDQAPDKPQGIYQDVALAAFDLLACVISAMPPFWAVSTDWLSIIPAVGVSRFPAFFLTARRKAS